MSASPPGPKPSSNGKIIMIIVAVVVFLALGGCCVFGSMFGGMFAAFGAVEKTYVPECENLGASEACQTCCRQNGHNGYVYGGAMNDNGQLCGCL